MVESKTFKPDLAQIDELLESYRLDAPDNEESITIDPAQAVTPIDDHFTCTICLGVAMDPKECQTCNKLNCKKCINDWL